jgi:HD-GYP domain-containing protein (c-di-GMP phosphodiesterase class II)
MSSYILGELELPQLVKEMARWHLERRDGNGGPDGLAGESIPIFDRILAVADAVDATSFSEVAEQSGTRFCPTTVAATHRALAADRALRDYVAA